MGMTLVEIRQKYPEYDSKSDEELAEAIHSKYYSGLPKEKVYEKLGLFPQNESPKPMQLEVAKPASNNKADWRGLASDTVHMLGKVLKGGMGFLSKAPGNLAEVGSELAQHPLSYPPHVAQQVLAGLGGGVKDLANIPHKVFDELADRKITPDWLRTGSIPEDTGVEKFLGLQPTKKSDELLRAIPTLFGGGKLVASGIGKVKKALTEPDLKAALRETQNKVNVMDKKYGKTLDKIESQVKSRGINDIPINSKLLSEAESLLDKSPETKALIKSSKKGDYKSLRQLQADLRVIGENSLSNKLSTERNVGKQALSVRDRINKGIEDHFKSTGNKDLAEDLNSTREGYRNMKDIYFSTPALARIFGKRQNIPKNPLTLLTEENVEMNKFKEAHPEIAETLEEALSHKKKMALLKAAGKIFGTGVVGGGTVSGISSFKKH